MLSVLGWLVGGMCCLATFGLVAIAALVLVVRFLQPPPALAAVRAAAPRPTPPDPAPLDRAAPPAAATRPNSGEDLVAVFGGYMAERRARAEERAKQDARDRKTHQSILHLVQQEQPEENP